MMQVQGWSGSSNCNSSGSEQVGEMSTPLERGNGTVESGSSSTGAASISNDAGTGSSSSCISNGTSNSSSRGGHEGPLIRAEVFDWDKTELAERFDVVLACDVLYEDAAVEPIARVVPQLLKATSGTLLLADPPNRTAQNRERCVKLLAESSKPAALVLQECCQFACEVAKLDPEMVGGVDKETVPVQFMAFSRTYGNDTIGLKL